jgi:hypothetical protein
MANELAPGRGAESHSRRHFLLTESSVRRGSWAGPVADYKHPESYAAGNHSHLCQDEIPMRPVHVTPATQCPRMTQEQKVLCLHSISE